MSLELHPDFFCDSSDDLKALSETATSILNSAYSTLRDPSARANYMLKILNEGNRLDERSLPDGFLEEMFFLQESLDDLLESNKNDELSKLLENLFKRRNNLILYYSVIFKKFDRCDNNSQLLQQLQTNLNAERYLHRLIERIPEKD